MENSSSETVNEGQETDWDCEDKQREAALFLLQLKEKTKLQQSVIDNVLQGVTVLFKKSVHRLKRKVTELLESEGLSDIAASDSLQDLWRDEATPFEGLETNHLQEQYMNSTFPCVVGVKHSYEEMYRCRRGWLLHSILYCKMLHKPLPLPTTFPSKKKHSTSSIKNPSKFKN